MKELYEEKGARYYDRASWGVIGAVEPGRHKILEIGCSAGKTGETLKQTGKALEVVGVDLSPAAVAVAAERLDRAICCNIEETGLPYPAEYFDYILCGDVLEHLQDPWTALKKLSQYLKADHFLIASIPNIRNWRVLRDLILHGRWEYVPAGILDFTHLRFFTKRSIIELFDGAGFEVEQMEHLPFPRKEKLANLVTFGLAKDFLVKQYLVKARKRHA
jgi:2-polyprenyl-3-methyl-5-hydroxy-6-metoxy-1,4-benzoquinol methylase